LHKRDTVGNIVNEGFDRVHIGEMAEKVPEMSAFPGGNE